MKIHIRPLIALISTISILIALSFYPKAENESNFNFGGALPNTLEEMEFVLADVDGNASITAADSRHITRFSSGLITQMPLYD